MRSFPTKTLSSLIHEADSYLKHHGPETFSQKATDLLREAALHEHFDYRDLLKRSFSFKHEQNFKRLEFSDLPLTVARGKSCFIDVYFWRRRPTTIHNHHFTGAFQCLMGLNEETEFSWKLERKISKFHSLGKLSERKKTIIKPGDVQSIRLQDKFIHQSHHHADLTVNLCFRTPDIASKRLSNFLFSGVKIEKDSESLRRAEVLYTYATMEEVVLEELNLKNEDILNFMFHTLGTTQNPRIIKLQKKLSDKIKREKGVDVSRLINHHEKTLEKIQLSYS